MQVTCEGSVTAHLSKQWAWNISQNSGRGTSLKTVGVAHLSKQWAWHISQNSGRGTSLKTVGVAHSSSHHLHLASVDKLSGRSRRDSLSVEIIHRHRHQHKSKRDKFLLCIQYVMLVKVKLDVSGCNRITFHPFSSLSDDTAKIKLAILAFLYCEQFVKNPIDRHLDGEYLSSVHRNAHG